MKKILISSWVCLFFVTLGAHAGQSGYILNGKVIITHKDGEPLGETKEKTEKQKRNPAAVIRVQGTLFFDEDDLARCYWSGNQSNLFCIKK